MRLSLFIALLIAASACGGSGDGNGGGTEAFGPLVDVGPVALRRLTSDQYARSIRDVLGSDITVPSRIDPDDRRDGLRAVGASFVSISASGFEKYEAAAGLIAEQALDADHRDNVVPCTPASASAADDACARSFVESVGRRLFRRALTDEEIQSRVQLAAESAQALGDFYEGLELTLVSLLTSADFLFRVETTDPTQPSGNNLRLTNNSMASRLSFLLWNTTPDAALLDAAEAGELSTNDGLRAQAERLAQDPRAAEGIREFFTDLYGLRLFDEGLVRKDTVLFPVFSLELAADAKEQTLRTIEDHVFAGKDYRDLFTTRDTFLTRTLGLVYQVPVVGETDSDGWAPFAYAEDSPRAGILTHISFMMQHAHPGRSSPTLRGQFVREVLLCLEVPTPPADVDFSIVEDVTGNVATARERLERHVTEPSCANCHNLTDPIGLAFENFDSIGAHRTTENGATIDTSGQLDGTSYTDAIGMGQALRDHPDLSFCLVRNLYRYAVGREPTLQETPLIAHLDEEFQASGYQVFSLLAELVMTDGFRAASGPRDSATGGAP